VIDYLADSSILKGDKKLTITVKTMAGFEEILVKEINALGILDVKVGLRHVTYEGTMEDVYRSCLFLRTAVRVLVPIATFKAFTPDRMYKKFMQFDWTQWMTLDHTFAINATVHSELFTHSQFAGLRVKDAIADHFREKFGRRPSVDVENPDISWDVHIDRQFIRLSLNMSGASLHKRGYRLGGAMAPISEVLAAGLVDLTGWDGTQTLWNPMCGTGTIAIEAARKAAGLPPHLSSRTFGFENLDGYDKELWQSIRQKAFDSKIKPDTIYASDIDIGVVALARKHADIAGVGDFVEITREDFFGSAKPADSGIIILNPPYGARIEIPEGFYKQMGDQLKTYCKGWNAYIISTPDKLKQVGLRPSGKIQVFNGSLECRFNRYEMYDGTRKVKHNNDASET
jgi:putative N6-adenine-specific DNA methylase